MADEVVERYRARSLLDDRAYAEGRVQTLHRQGRSRTRIAQTLAAKGVAREEIDRALAAFEAETPEADLVAALLALARGPEEPGQRDVQELHIASIVDDLLDRLAPLATQKGLRIERQLDPQARVGAAPGLGPVLIDNLLRNAVAHGDTWILVRADAQGIEIENDVRDPPRNSSSTGYGLQIVSRICERQGWAFTHGCRGDRFAARVAFAATSGT